MIVFCDFDLTDKLNSKEIIVVKKNNVTAY